MSRHGCGAPIIFSIIIISIIHLDPDLRDAFGSVVKPFPWGGP